MLINPNLPESKALLAPFPGTRLVQETLGVVGCQLLDPYNPLRIWTVQGLYSPIRGRVLGGLRAKLTDQKGFFTFINQRDLEVLLDLAPPGSYCPWLDSDYAGIDDREWIGFGVDADDLNDDLLHRESLLRFQHPDGTTLPQNTEIIRRVHDGRGNDYEERLILLWDMDPETGYGPDPRLATIEKRWRRVESTALRARMRLWQTI